MTIEELVIYARKVIEEGREDSDHAQEFLDLLSEKFEEKAA